MQVRWKNEILFFASKFNFNMIELGLVRGLFSKKNKDDKKTLDKIFVPQAIIADHNNILPLEATYSVSSGNPLTELNVHSIYPAVFAS